MQGGSVCVAIITYRRLDGLRRLLESLFHERLNGIAPSILVVDNDPAGSAREVVRAFDGVVYVLEPEPGIVSARNRALRTLPQEAEWVAFVDDDEWVAEGWLSALARVADEESADVVWGPVVSHFEDNVPNWIIRGGFIQRPGHDDRAQLKSAATNNVLIRRASISQLDNPFFDEGFSQTGGSDAELFWRLSNAGASILWASEAVVYEGVPGERATWRWIWRRLVRSGNVSARLMLRTRPRFYVFIVSGVRAVAGILFVIADLALGRGLKVRGLEHLGKAVGMAGTVAGVNVQEYRRR